MDPVAVGALSELIADAVVAATGRTWRSFKGNPEGHAIQAAIAAALSTALRRSVRPVGTEADDDWVAEVAGIWLPAFTPPVITELIACLADPTDVPAGHFAEVAERALKDHGCDLAELNRTFWVAEFLCILPRHFYASLRSIALRDEKVRDLVDHLFRQRDDSRASGNDLASPGRAPARLGSATLQLGRASASRKAATIPANASRP